MNLSITPESIVPEQSVIDSWPKLHRKKGGHACQGKCPNFTDEQCCHCLIKEIEAQEFKLGLAPDSHYVKSEDRYIDQALQSIREVS